MSESNYPTAFGVLMAPFHKIDVSPTLHYERDLQLIELVDRLGFQEAWLGEHHSGGYEPIGSPEILPPPRERTKTSNWARPSTRFPYHNPFLLAERLVTLDHLSRGRAIMGFGPGQLLPTPHPGHRPDEAARHVARGRGGHCSAPPRRTVTEKTDWFDLAGRVTTGTSLQPAGTRIVVAAVTSPSGPVPLPVGWIGDDNLAATGPGAFDALRGHWEITDSKEARPGEGRLVANWRLAAIIHIAETEEQARQDCTYGFEDIWNYLGRSRRCRPPRSQTTER